MTYINETAKIRAISGQGGFSVFALLLSFGLVMLGLFAAEYPRPDAATGDPFLFVLRP